MKEPIQFCCREASFFRHFLRLSYKNYVITGFEEATITNLLYLGRFDLRLPDSEMSFGCYSIASNSGLALLSWLQT